MSTTIKLLTIIIILNICFSFNSNAGEFYLCIDENDETVTMMDVGGLCDDGDNEHSFSGFSDEMIYDMVIISEFLPNENCKTADTKIVKIGIDKDGDNIIDPGELLSMSESCPIKSANE